ncbi:hypothetical protein K437DRAFT_259260 [Tilletiaria anomala UBC 951]|uniref:Uncharacterized protein n=1 Tax=Tilletiaria anomala (strain ATCC 24038 / CBS 436.72 / UBC 951) TaxID=1037660 RepID=A0A066VJY8_TILAU|nr:uncharacterized protein K437DRAFT_259260 [Tilletiaria anomala UBC 951]KDN38860.1 hypothetical protein K437DRAFT_259260 [Tilletiaria anomala UBC 951]
MTVHWCMATICTAECQDCTPDHAFVKDEAPGAVYVRLCIKRRGERGASSEKSAVHSTCNNSIVHSQANAI